MRHTLIPALLAIGCAAGDPGVEPPDGGGPATADRSQSLDDPDARVWPPGDPDAAGGEPGDPDAGGDQPGDPDAGGGGGVLCPGGGLGPWNGFDDVAPSDQPPCNLSPADVPQFVVIGFDDNAYSGLPGSGGDGGMDWAVDMIAARTNPDGSPARATFYLTSTYIDLWYSESPVYVKQAWRAALQAGNEIGDHTHLHSHGGSFSNGQWQTEIETCIDWLTKPYDPNETTFSPDSTKGIGATAAQIVGFRTPFLEYNDATLAEVRNAGLWYDASIEDGYQDTIDGTNFLWPYTLDGGSPGHDVLVAWGLRQPIAPHPGLWELPVYPVVVPPNLRAAMQQRQSWFDPASGKMTGFDYNMWVQFSMTKDEFVQTMQHTLDLRLSGNRAPFLFGAHTDYYSSKYTAPTGATPQQRREAIEEFLDYALSHPDVRVVSAKQVLDWVRNPD